MISTKLQQIRHTTNNSDIKSFLKIISVIQLAMFGVMGLDAIRLDIPILRQVLAFIYLTFVPGAIILRIFKIHNIDKTKFILYSAGLSITFIMFAGAFVNSVLLSLKILHPISPLSLTTALSIFITLLCVIAYFCEKEFQPLGINYVGINTHINMKNLLSPQCLFLLLPPFFAVFGTFFINLYKNSTLSFLLFAIIAIIAALIAFDKFISAEAYSLAVFTIALSLLLHVSLISLYPYGWNIDGEYYFSELVATNGYWDSSLSSSVINSLLSIIMLAPIYSKMLDINIIWIFKTIFPLFHSLLPLAMFAAYREQMDSKKAFFSSFFFMSLSGFFESMVFFRREQVGMLFLALIVLVMVDNKLTSLQKSALAIPFIISLPVSHYGTSYLTLALFFFGWILLYLTFNAQAIYNRKTNKKLIKNVKNQQKTAYQPSILKSIIILVWLVFMLAWFMYIASGVSFSNYVDLMRCSFLSLNDFFNPECRPENVYAAVGVGLPPIASVLNGIFRIIHYSTEALIIVGFITLIIRPKIFKLKEEYKTLLIITALLLFIVMVLPSLGKYWDTYRFYNFTLVIIAPLIVFGSEAICKLTSWLIKYESLFLINKLRRHKSILNLDSKIYIRLLVIAILVPYFLFNTGFINEIGKNYVDVTGVHMSSALNSGNIDTLYFNEREVSGAEWIRCVSGKYTIAAGDSFCNTLLSFWFNERFLLSLEKEVPKSAYIYLRTWNVEKQEVLIEDSIHETIAHINPNTVPVLHYAFSSRDKIYDNGGAQILALARNN